MPDFNQIWIFSKNFHKVSKIKFHGNPYCGNRADACGQRNGHDEDSTGAFRDYGDAPIKEKYNHGTSKNNFAEHYAFQYRYVSVVANYSDTSANEDNSFRNHIR